MANDKQDKNNEASIFKDVESIFTDVDISCDDCCYHTLGENGLYLTCAMFGDGDSVVLDPCEEYLRAKWLLRNQLEKRWVDGYKSGQRDVVGFDGGPESERLD